MLAAIHGLRRHHRPIRSGMDDRRARIVRPSRNRPRSSASAPAVAYRRAGSREMALWMMVSRSGGTFAFSFRSGRGPSFWIRCITL